MFWVIAIASGVIVSGLLFWPALRAAGRPRITAVLMVVAIPIAALLIYRQVGTPEGIGVSGSPPQQQGAMNHPATGDAGFTELVNKLERRLQENPADLEGWILLGRSYKTIQRYDASETALIRAAQLAPEDPLVLAELAEAKLFNSGQTTVSAEVRAMLERVLTLDPNQQKSLWLLGIAARQDGNDALAVELWERLVAQMDPQSNAARSINEQIGQARSRLGASAPRVAGADDWVGLQVDVDMVQPAPGLPASATLFVIVRHPTRPGPPLGVIRIDRPAFPVTTRLTDANSMMPELLISDADQIEVMARLSMSGNVVAQPGDWQSAPQTVRPDASEGLRLVLQPD